MLPPSIRNKIRWDFDHLVRNSIDPWRSPQRTEYTTLAEKRLISVTGTTIDAFESCFHEDVKFVIDGVSLALDDLIDADAKNVFHWWRVLQLAPHSVIDATMVEMKSEILRVYREYAMVGHAIDLHKLEQQYLFDKGKDGAHAAYVKAKDHLIANPPTGADKARYSLSYLEEMRAYLKNRHPTGGFIAIVFLSVLFAGIIIKLVSS